jgi:hypothetical protein
VTDKITPLMHPTRKYCLGADRHIPIYAYDDKTGKRVNVASYVQSVRPDYTVGELVTAAVTFQACEIEFDERGHVTAFHLGAKPIE